MNVDQILDLLEGSDLQFEDDDDYDADPSFTLPNLYGNNILCESSDSEVELEDEQLETGRQVSADVSVTRNDKGDTSIFKKVKWRIPTIIYI